MSNQSKSLFHYTSGPGLVGIISKQSLYATHYSFLNDSSECQLLSSLLIPKIEAQFEELIPRLVRIGALKPELYEQHGKNVHRQEAERIMSSIIKATNNIAPFYISSFCIHDEKSTEYSHGLLSQWRSYGKGGFAIEFDELKLDKLIFESENERFQYDSLATRAVAYEDHKTAIKEDDFAGLAASAMKKVLPFSDKIPELKNARDFVEFITPFITTAPFLKHVNFKEENEYRIVALAGRRNKYEGKTEKKIKSVEYRYRNDGSLVPYISLFEDEDLKLPIKSVLVGPHPEQTAQKLAVETLLEKHGLDVPVRLAEIPFRAN